MIGCIVIFVVMLFLAVIIFYFESKEKNRRCENCNFFSKKTSYNKCKINGRFVSKNNKCKKFIGD